MTPIRFRVILAEPEKHRVRIEATFHGVGEISDVRLLLPVWSPGSYMVREYAQFLSRLQVTGDDGRQRSSRKVDKSSWKVDCRDTNSIHVSYEVYGHDLGVRNNHIDGTHAFLTPTALFLYPETRLADAIEVEVVAPEGWKVFTQLERPIEAHDFFSAVDFDELYDSPIEVGPHPSFEFEAAGARHTVAIWGRGNYDVDRLKRDMPALVETNAAVFGGKVPYDHYLTILLLTDGVFGGLEHRRSTALMFPRHEFCGPKGSLDVPISDDKYLGFLALFAHEHFHTWHVKRIRPVALGPFDYQNENYTRDIWSIEGITNYYNDLALLRARRIQPVKFLEFLADQIKKLDGIPGRLAQSLEESSFDAWIRLYRSHENNLNSTVSYYLKGHIVAAMLDVFLCEASGGAKGLDDVMKFLWQHHSKERGYPEAKFDELVFEATGIEVATQFDTWVRRAEELDYEGVLALAGLTLKKSHGKHPAGPWIGVKTRANGDRLMIDQVSSDGPSSGFLSPGDELVAIDGFKVSATNLDERLRVAGIGNSTVFHVFRYAELVDFPIIIGEEPPTKYEILADPLAASGELAVRKSWLGTDTIEEITN
jgi:predicted metalloprotease with PDZ domain